MREKIGVVCCGGGGAGVLQAGMLKALPHVDVLSGASVGALNATMYAQGDVDTLCDLWTSLRRKDVYRWGLWNLFNRKSFTNVTPLYNVINRYVNIDKLQHRVYILATDSITGEAVWASNETEGYVDVLKGSCAIPIVFPEVKYRDTFLMDGGVYDNSPMWPLIKEGCTKIYILHAHPVKEVQRRQEALHRRNAIFNTINILFQANQHSDRALAEYINRRVREGSDVFHREIQFIDIYPEISVGTLEFNPKLAPYRMAHGAAQLRKSLT